MSLRTLRMSVGLLAGMACAGLAAAVAGAAVGLLTPTLSALSLACGVLGGALAGRSLSVGAGEAVSEPIGWASVVALAAFLAVSVRQFLRVCFERGASVETLLPNNYGDLPLHWTYVSFLARGARFWPENPIAAGERLRYPFGVDLVSALWVQLGVGVPVLFCVMGLVGAALAAHALYLWGRGFALAAFLFSGGWAGLRAVASAGLLEPAADLAWKNLFLALFVPQRGFLYALPAGLLLLWSWRRRFLRGDRGLSAWVEGLLWGAMPLFHLHTFLFVSLVGAVWAVGGRKAPGAWPVLAWAFLPATWSVWEVTEGFRSASLVWWKVGWVIGPQNPVAFLALNFGLWLPLVILALARAWRRHDREALLTLGPGLGLFVLLFFLMLAPWDWDNTKVMLWCFLAVMPATFDLAVRPLGLVSRAAVVALLILPGVATVTRASLPGRPPLVVADRDELDAVCAAMRTLRIGDRVAVAATFNHPVALCGQPVAVGYPGHLWSHGIPPEKLEAALRRLMLGEGDWREAARALHVRAVFWGAREHEAYPGSSRPWGERGGLGVGRWGELFLLEDGRGPAAP